MDTTPTIKLSEDKNSVIVTTPVEPTVQTYTKKQLEDGIETEQTNITNNTTQIATLTEENTESQANITYYQNLLAQFSN